MYDTEHDFTTSNFHISLITRRISPVFFFKFLHLISNMLLLADGGSDQDRPDTAVGIYYYCMFEVLMHRNKRTNKSLLIRKNFDGQSTSTKLEIISNFRRLPSLVYLLKLEHYFYSIPIINPQSVCYARNEEKLFISLSKAFRVLAPLLSNMGRCSLYIVVSSSGYQCKR